VLDRLGQEFSASVDSAIEALRQFKDGKLQWLRNEKEQLSAVVEAANKEAQACLAQGTQPTTELAQKLWTLPPYQIPQVVYSLNPPNFQIACEIWVNYSNEVTPNWQAISNAKCSICYRFINASEQVNLPCGHSCHLVCTSSQQCQECGFYFGNR